MVAGGVCYTAVCHILCLLYVSRTVQATMHMFTGFYIIAYNIEWNKVLQLADLLTLAPHVGREYST